MSYLSRFATRRPSVRVDRRTRLNLIRSVLRATPFARRDEAEIGATSVGAPVRDATGQVVRTVMIRQPDGTTQQAAVRECLEETACAFVPQALVGVYLSRFQRPASGEDVTYVRFAFCGKILAHHPERTLDEGIVRAVAETAMAAQAPHACHELEQFPGHVRRGPDA